MKKVIVSINVTLDGFCDHTAVIADDELHKYANDRRNHFRHKDTKALSFIRFVT